MSYDPPEGYQAGLTFTTAYTPPDGYKVGLEFEPGGVDPGSAQYVFPASILDTVFGDLAVRHQYRSLAPAGFASFLGGAPTIYSLRKYAVPAGIAAGSVGTQKIENRNRRLTLTGIAPPPFGTTKVEKTPELLPPGIPPGAFGALQIELKTRYVYAGVGASQMVFGLPSIINLDIYARPSGFASQAFGTPSITHGRRTLLAPGIANPGVGNLTITHRNRTLYPAGIFLDRVGRPMVGGLRFTGPFGFEATRWGARIIPEAQYLYPRGFVGEFGDALLYNLRQLVRPTGFATGGAQPADRWGMPLLYNLRQYVAQFYDPDSGLVPPPWPQWTLIENRNKVMGAIGADMLRLGFPQIDNKARLLKPAGLASPAITPSHMLAYRVRLLPLQGVEAPYFSGWSRIYNDARVIAPAGLVGSVFGVARVESNLQTLRWIGAFDAMAMGHPMVADRVRGVIIERRHSIDAPPIPLPEVKLHRRYIDGIGNDLARVGWASMEIHWTRITPRWTLQNLYGVPTVRNLTPEVRTSGRASDEWGDPFVRLQWRPVTPEGAKTELFGRAGIAYRDRTVYATGIRSLVVSDRLAVAKTGAPPYATQAISLVGPRKEDDTFEDGNGIEVPDRQVPPPNINQQVIRHYQSNPHTAFGAARVTANSIRVEPGYWEILAGKPMVSLKVRRVTVAEWEESQVFLPPSPRVSPHTIWAVVEAPEQAKANHALSPGQQLHYVDGWHRPPGAIFGNARVTLRHRIVRAIGSYMTLMGTPGIFNRSHYIRPSSWNGLRFGWHTIPGPQDVLQFDPSSTMVFGTATVKRPPYIGPQTIAPVGLGSQRFGVPLVEFFNREVRPTGLYATLMGTRLANDTPYMWQGLRVGPLMPTIPAGNDMSRYGTQWVSHRVRGIEVPGINMFAMEYQLEAFDKRMRVTRRAAPRPVTTIAPQGFLAFLSSAANVRPGAHYIRPDGNSDQHRKGAF